MKNIRSRFVLYVFLNANVGGDVDVFVCPVRQKSETVGFRKGSEHPQAVDCIKLYRHHGASMTGLKAETICFVCVLRIGVENKGLATIERDSFAFVTDWEYTSGPRAESLQNVMCLHVR